MPGIVLSGRCDGPVKVCKVIVEEGFVLVQGVRSHYILETQVGELLCQGRCKLVEKPPLSAVRDILPGKQVCLFGECA